MQARKTASQYAHPFIAATLIACTFAFTATLAQAQVPASAERDINLSISIGASQSQSKTTQSSDSARGSTVTASHNVSISATGAGQNSDLTIQGSSVKAGNNLSLQADDEIHLLAARNSAGQRSSNQNSSGSIGVSMGTGGIGVTVSASAGRGNADASDVTHSNTRVQAGNTVNIQSGGNTTLAGAVVAAHTVKAQVGGDLLIQSLQDSSQYASKQQSFGASLTVGAGVSGSVSASRSNIRSNFASVGEQSGIQAGDGGFQLNVQGNTELKGGGVTSTQAAVDQDKNQFQTGGTLTLSDIQNQASYQAKAAGVSIGVGGGTSSGGLGKDSGNASSTTQAAISGIAGNLAARTGEAEIGLGRIFDADKVQREINAQVQITQSFGQQASKAVDDHAKNQMKRLRERHDASTDPEEKQALQARVDELRLQTQVMNVLIGAVTGLGTPALARETLAAAAEAMRQITIEDSRRFQGITDGDGTIVSNVSGQSAGGRWDLTPVKTGGTRIDLDRICGKDNERCERNAGGSLALNDKGQVQFIGSLPDFIKTPEGRKMEGITGGHQGLPGTLLGMPYAPGGLIDRVIEAFGGTHDHAAKVSGLYDEQGNARRGRADPEKMTHEVWSVVTIAPSAPFAMATLLPPEVWKAISILLGAAK